MFSQYLIAIMKSKLIIDISPHAHTLTNVGINMLSSHYNPLTSNLLFHL